MEEEIAIYQFGQGVEPIIDLLANFNQLDEKEQSTHLYELYHLLRQLDTTESDIDQAMVASSLGPDYKPCVVLNTNRSGHIQLRMPGSNLEQEYVFLLTLFRIVYQRRLGAEKVNTTKWQYRDLSLAGVAQELLASYQALVEQVYANTSFRSEFASLAKLWYERKTAAWASPREPAPENKTKFDFQTYDEMVTASLNLIDSKYVRAISLLRHSIDKALSIKYGLDAEQTNKVVLDVIERHMRETYGTGLFRN